MFENGIDIVKVDFHMHTNGDKEFKYVGDPEYYISEYIQQLVDNEISIGIITNHNKFVKEEYDKLRKTGKRKGCCILPGVELSVKEGANGVHTLIVFKPEDWLCNGTNNIEIFLNEVFRDTPNRENENTRCKYDLPGVMEILERYNSDFFIVFAHVEQPSGIIHECDGGLIKTLAAYPWFRRRVLGIQKVRTRDDIKKFEEHLGYKLPYLEGSDCKNIKAIGKGNSVTFVKLGALSFDALKFALRAGTEIEDIQSKIRDINHKLKIFEEHGVAAKLAKQTGYATDLTEAKSVIANSNDISKRLHGICDYFRGMSILTEGYSSTHNKKLFEKINDHVHKIKEHFINIEKEAEQIDTEIQILYDLKKDLEGIIGELREEFAEIRREIQDPKLDIDAFGNYKENLDLYTRDENLKKMKLERREPLKQEILSVISQRTEVLRDRFCAYKQEIDRVNSTQEELKLSIEFKGNKKGFLAQLKEQFRGTGINESRYADIVNEFSDMLALIEDVLFREGLRLKPLITDNQYASVFEKIKTNYADMVELETTDMVEIKYHGIYMELALTKSSWSVIGYVSHKEYSGDFLLNWYNALVDLDEANIHRFAREIKDISDKIELLGDNRMRHHIDSKIFSDVFSEGIKDIISFLKNEYYFSQAMKSPYYLVDGLTGYLRKNNPNREQLLLIWTTGMVLLDWRLEDNHSSIAALQKAIEICALRNGYCDIHSDLSLLGPAYINLMGDPVKYIIPDRCVDNTSFSEETTSVEYYEQMIHEYVQDKSYSSTAILEACESLHNKDALKESVVLEIMEHEFFKESSSIERNSLLEYLISFGKAEETDVLIRKYLGMLLQRDHYYCALDVPALVLWKMKQLSPEYGINGMKQILDMHRSWRTAAGHIKDVELTNEIFFTKLVDWNESTDLYTLFLDIALLLIKSEDADAARTALAGVFATLRVEPGYINFIEKMWDSFHYRAKEWILMIYELLWDYREDFHDNMLTILKKHCEDEDFNVSLYSNLLLENYSSDDSFKYIRNSKSYFDEIPNRGHKLFIKKNRPSPWINGYDCVMEQIELLSERLEVDGEHLEKRVADYCDKIPDTVQLIKLGRKWWGCRVVCENPNRSFLRVLYKDWYNHKFDWEEAELGRIVLSASEPYCLLITPQLWTYNNGYLLNPPESFISSSSVEQKKQIHDILFEGVDDTETVLAGGIIDYTHKEEIFGFMVSYFSIPGLPSKYAAYCYERNSRLLLQSRPDFSEQEHYNITLHHNGIESFQGSNIMCGFSKISLDEFHWHINITVNGMRLFNEGGQEIGRFEYYYGQRGNMGNRYISNQPLLQRWVVSKDAISKARCIVGCPNNIKINHAFDSVIRKYED